MAAKFRSPTEYQELIGSVCRHWSDDNAKLQEVYHLLGRFTKFMENMFEIAQVAARLTSANKIEYEDSQNFFYFCKDLAVRFEEENPDGCDDYYSAIEDYAQTILLQEFGVPEIPKSMKDTGIYRSDYHAVCYVPENAQSMEDSYSHSRLLALVQGDEVLCDLLFYNLNWPFPFPETWIDEQLREGLWSKCEACGRIYPSYDNDIAECPRCHTLLPGDEDPFEACTKALAEEKKEKGE